MNPEIALKDRLKLGLSRLMTNNPVDGRLLHTGRCFSFVSDVG